MSAHRNSVVIQLVSLMYSLASSVQEAFRPEFVAVTILVMRSLFEHFTRVHPEKSLSISIRHKQMVYIIQKLLRFNLFATPSRQESEDVQIIHDQILSTRVYVLLLTTALLVISAFTILTPVYVFTTVPQPSLSTYLALEDKYAGKLSCLCQHLAVTFSSFFSIEPAYHEVNILMH